MDYFETYTIREALSCLSEQLESLEISKKQAYENFQECQTYTVLAESKMHLADLKICLVDSQIRKLRNELTKRFVG